MNATANVVFSNGKWEITSRAKERMAKQITELSDEEISACIQFLVEENANDSMVAKYTMESPLAFIRYFVKIEALKKQGYNILDLVKTKTIFQGISDLCFIEGAERLNTALQN